MSAFAPGQRLRKRARLSLGVRSVRRYASNRRKAHRTRLHVPRQTRATRVTVLPLLVTYSPVPLGISKRHPRLPGRVIGDTPGMIFWLASQVAAFRGLLWVIVEVVTTRCNGA
jgi:hypothetical protein